VSGFSWTVAHDISERKARKARKHNLLFFFFVFFVGFEPFVFFVASYLRGLSFVVKCA
jgi:hypothetical protein